MIEAQHRADLRELFDQLLRCAERERFPTPIVELQRTVVFANRRFALGKCAVWPISLMH